MLSQFTVNVAANKKRPGTVKPPYVESPIKGKYAGFNFRHFVEKRNEAEGISITYRNAHRILTVKVILEMSEIVT